jgi:surfactin synthase thioesterase subunit
MALASLKYPSKESFGRAVGHAFTLDHAIALGRRTRPPAHIAIVADHAPPHKSPKKKKNADDWT